METYVLPPVEEKSKEEHGLVSSPGDYDRKIRIPVNDDILEAFKTNDTVVVVLKGEICGTENREFSDYTSKEITLNLSAVTVDSDEPDEESLKKIMKESFEDR